MAKLADLKKDDWVTPILPDCRYYGQVTIVGDEFVRVRWVCVERIVQTRWTAPDEVRKISPLEMLAYQDVE